MSTVAKVIKQENKAKYFSKIVTYIKLIESFSFSFFSYLSGYIRSATDSYTGVTLLMVITAILTLNVDLLLIHENQSFGS